MKDEEISDRWAPLDYPGGLIDSQWLLGQWNAIPQLTCIHCKWDTLEGIEAAREHAAKCPRCQPQETRVEPSPILRADKFGRIVDLDSR